MARNYSNTGQTSTLVAAVGATDTVLALNNYAGDPTPPFTGTLSRGTINEEVVLVTAVNGNTVTVSRGWDGTSAQAQGAGSTFQHAVVAQDFRDIQTAQSAATAAQSNASAALTTVSTHTGASGGVHGATGAVVGTTDVQTLSNKTLTSPTVNDPVMKAGGSTVNWKWVQLTQAAYTALGTKDAATMYLIVG